MIQDKILGKIVFCRVFCPPNVSLLDDRSLAGCCKPGSNVVGYSVSPDNGCFCKKYKTIWKWPFVKNRNRMYISINRLYKKEIFIYPNEVLKGFRNLEQKHKFCSINGGGGCVWSIKTLLPFDIITFLWWCPIISFM